MSLRRNECVVAVGECDVQPASARRSAIKYNETGFAVLRADESMCNVQRKHAETNAVRSTQNGLQRKTDCKLQTRAKASKLQRAEHDAYCVLWCANALLHCYATRCRCDCSLAPNLLHSPMLLNFHSAHVNVTVTVNVKMWM